MSAPREQVLDYSWLHDDTEEDLVGADWRKHAIRALSTSLQALVDERRWPWHVSDQLTLVGEKPNGKGVASCSRCLDPPAAWTGAARTCTPLISRRGIGIPMPHPARIQPSPRQVVRSLSPPPSGNHFG